MSPDTAPNKGRLYLKRCTAPLALSFETLNSNFIWRAVPFWVHRILGALFDWGPKKIFFGSLPYNDSHCLEGQGYVYILVTCNHLMPLGLSQSTPFQLTHFLYASKFCTSDYVQTPSSFWFRLCPQKPKTINLNAEVDIPKKPNALRTKDIP